MYTDKHLDKPLITTATPIMSSPLNDIHLPHALSPTAQHTMHHGHHGQTQLSNIGHSHHHPHSTIQQQRQHLHAQHLTATQHQQQQHAALTQHQHLAAAQQQHPHHQQQQIHQHQQQQQPNMTNQNQQQHQQQQQQHQQQQSAMFARFDANKSTKGASKLRRDLINAEISNLRDLLPLPQSTRQRLSQLQLMALVCVYVRKANYFQQVFKRRDISTHHTPTPNIGFSKALSGFLMMLTQNGKLLYISDNAAEYLGHSMEDLLIHGDSVYDIIDKQDHAAIQAELNRNVPQQPGQHASSAAAAAAALSSLEGEHRMFLCRMNVSRNARRQMRFGDQKVVLVQGHYLSFLPLCSRNEPVFLATCTPIAMPETRECVVQGATNVFTTIHSMDMKIAHIDKNGEFHLGYSKSEIQGVSWYNLIHSEHLREAQNKHRLITQSEQDRSCILLVRMLRRHGDFIWVHVVLQVRDSQDASQQPVVVCTNQVLNDREASVMIANSWLYHYYSVQSKIQFGLPFEGSSRMPPTASVYYHAHPHHTNTQHQLPASLPAALPPNAGIGSGYPTAMHPQYHHMAAYGGLYNLPTNAAPSHIVGHLHNNCTAAGGSSSSGLVGVDNHVSHDGYTGNSYQQSSYQQRLSEGGGTQPVDYSQQQQVPGVNSSASPPTLATLTVVQLRCSSANSSASSTPSFANSSKSNNGHVHGTMQHLSSPPPAKKRAITIGKLEPLYLTSDSPEPGAHLTDLESHYQNHTQNHAHTPPMGVYSAESHGSVIFATVVPTRPRLLSKALPPDPPDFIDQWNPSPPWSETAQKICMDSSCSQQELSPCITTTPPTPTSAPPAGGQTLGPGPAFSFEWMSDQCVPIIDGCAQSCMSCMSSNGLPVVMAHSHHHSHAHTHPHAHHWMTAVTPVQLTIPHDEHHRPHAHRLISLHSSLTVNESNTGVGSESNVTKSEVLEDVDEKGGSSALCVVLLSNTL